MFYFNTFAVFCLDKYDKEANVQNTITVILGKTYKLLMIALLGYILFSLISPLIETPLSVTWINIISGIVLIFVGTPIMIAGAMANDSGKGGVVIHTIQFLTMSYPLTYLIGLIGSIAVLYSDLDNSEEIALWLALMSGIHLIVIALFFTSALLVEHYNDMRRQ